MPDDDAEVRRLTLADLKKGLSLQSGRRYKLVILADLVEVHIDWPTYIVQRLPDDFVLALSGPDLAMRELTKDAATAVDDGMTRFAFRWRDKNKTVVLEASGAGQKVVLWRGHVSGDLGVAVDWDGRLDPLLAPYEEVEIAGQDSGATEVSSDLRAHELAVLMANLLS
jgi:hypothetical protein